MPLTPLSPTDTRPLFRPVTDALTALLRSLPDEAWTRAAVGSWQVRDVVAHLTDVSLRRVAFHRDRHIPPPPPFAIGSDADFVRFINHINAEWVGATKRLSTRQLTEMYARTARELSDFLESLAFEAPGLFGVSWAGEMESAGWFDIGREFTEQWHHQAQIREAVGAPALEDPAWLHATLAILLRGLPHAFRTQAADDGTAIGLHITGVAGGHWTLAREGGCWQLGTGEPSAPAASITLSDDAAWRLFTNGLSDARAREECRITGDVSLAEPLFRARSIVV